MIAISFIAYMCIKIFSVSKADIPTYPVDYMYTDYRIISSHYVSTKCSN